MLSKLMKHELRATERILLPVYLLLLVTAGLSRLFLLLAEHYDSSTAISIFRNLTLAAFILTAIGTGILTVILMVYRFYKNLMTDEGYLMFTLPVTADQIIFSKLLSALIWTAVTAIAEGIAVLIVSIGDGALTELFNGIPLFIQQMQISVPELIDYTLEGLVLAVLAVWSTYLMFYAAISLGHSFANHKILLSVVFYLAFSVALQVISSFGLMFGLVAIIPDDLFLDGDNLALSFQLIAWCGIAWSLLVSAIFYFLTRIMLKRRLNLQ